MSDLHRQIIASTVLAPFVDVVGSRVAVTFPATIIVLLPFVSPSKPTVMPGIDVPPAVIVEIKELMTSTSEKVIWLRSVNGRVFGELS